MQHTTSTSTSTSTSTTSTTTQDASTSPELAAACRALLATTGLPAWCWGDSGPGPVVEDWLGCEVRPATLTADQWTMLLVCWGLWAEAGPFAGLAEVTTIHPRSFVLLASYLQARNIGAEDMWSEAHCA